MLRLMDLVEATHLAQAALESLGVASTPVPSRHQIQFRVHAADVLLPADDGLQLARTGLPGFVGSFPVRYLLEDGSTCGTH